MFQETWHRTFCEKAYWILRDSDLSKDTAQECWIIIIARLHTLKKTDSFKPWALRIIYTKSIDALKRRNKATQELKAVDYEDFNESSTSEDKEELRIKMLKAVQELSKDKQDIIRLFYVEENTIKEISAFLDIPLGTVKSRLFKAREKLKSIIKL